MTKRRKSKTATAVYEEATASLMAQLAEGDVLPWTPPWDRRVGLPTSLATGNTYSGINVLILWDRMRRRGFGSRYWMTFKQAQKLGGHVRRGERSTKVVAFNVRRYTELDEDGEQIERRRAFAKHIAVFNMDQCDGIADPAPDPDEDAAHRDERIDAWTERVGVRIENRGTRAYYRPDLDAITMPAVSRFKDRESYYATLFHELIHWTGHANRLNRIDTSRFGDPAYAEEELVAEVGAAFLCAEFGVSGDLRHAGYLDHWLRSLGEAPEALVRAASRAQKAVDLLHAAARAESGSEAA